MQVSYVQGASELPFQRGLTGTRHLHFVDTMDVGYYLLAAPLQLGSHA